MFAMGKLRKRIANKKRIINIIMLTSDINTPHSPQDILNILPNVRIFLKEN